MKVSVVMQTYGHERFIADAIEGVLLQQVDAEVELLIGDDASPDDTEQIVRRYAREHPDVIRYIRHTRNVGSSANCVDLLRRASGTYVAICDGDDRWTDPGKLRAQIGLLEARPDVTMSCHGLRVVDEDGQLLEASRVQDLELDRFEYTLDDLLELGPVFGHSSFVYRAHLVKASDPIDSFKRDWVLQLKCARSGPLHYSGCVQADYRKHAGGWTTRAKVDERFRTRNYWNLIGIAEHVADWPHDERRRRRYIAHVHYDFASESLARRRYLKFARAISRSVAVGAELSDYQRHLYRFRYVMPLYQAWASIRAALARLRRGKAKTDP